MGDFANAARYWMKEVQVELKSCIKFFQECKTRFEKVREQNCECREFQKRAQRITEDIDSILHLGENTILSTETLLKETTSDATVVEAILGIERNLLAIFRQRQRYTGCTLFVVSKAITVKPNKSNIQQSCTCVLTELPAKCAGIMTTSFYTQQYAKSDEKATTDEKLVKNVLSCTFVGKEKYSYELGNPYSMGKPDIVTGQLFRYNNAQCIVNCLYPNKFLDRYELTNYGMPIDGCDREMVVVQISNGNIFDEPSR